MKHTLLVLTACFPLLVFGQKKIDNKIYLYGNVTQKISDVTAILFSGADPKNEIKVVKYFEKQGAKAVSWHSLFIPGTEYSNEEISKVVSDNNINTIVIIQLTDRSTANHSTSQTYVFPSENYGKATTLGDSFEYTAGVSLQMEIYSIQNGLDKPLGVIVGAASGDWGYLSTESGIAKKVLRRMLDGLKKENAFK